MSKSDQDKLAELYALAERNMPKPTTPEQRAEGKARLHEVVEHDPVSAWETLQKALEPQLHDPADLEERGQLWDKWADEKDVHAKALLQLQLGEQVAGLLEHIEAQGVQMAATCLTPREREALRSLISDAVDLRGVGAMRNGLRRRFTKEELGALVEKLL